MDPALIQIPRVVPPSAVVHALAFDHDLEPGPIAVPESLAKAVAKRRSEFIAGRLCARAALASLGGPVDPPLAIGSNRAPEWPPGFVGSITHGDHLAAAAVARSTDLAGLGIDIEEVVDEARSRSLAGQILNQAERERLEASSPDAWFTVGFAAKEALYKCLAPQVGRFFGFHDAEVVTCAADLLIVRLAVDLSEGMTAGRPFEVRYARFDGRVIAGLALDPE